MASTTFKELYDEIESGQVTTSSIPEGVYDVKVVRAQPLSTSNLIFLTFQVLNGPSAGKETDVNIYFPPEGAKRGARIYFHKKFAGFAAQPEVKAALQQAGNAPTDEQAFDIIAAALEDKTVTATVGLVSEGQYAGNNELRETKASAATTPPAAVPAQAPAATPVSEPESNGPGSFADTVQVPF